ALSCPDPRSDSFRSEAVRSTGPPQLSVPPKTTPSGFCECLHGCEHPAKLAGPFCDTTVMVLLPSCRNAVRSNAVGRPTFAAEAPGFVMLPTVPTETPLTRTSAKSSPVTERVPRGAAPTVKVRENAKRSRSASELGEIPGPEIH